MPINEYMFWFKVIQDDDAEQAKIHLNSSDEKDTLLSGHFVYMSCEKKCGVMKLKKQICRPLLLAVAYRAVKVLHVMLDNGADPEVVEQDESNILHSLTTSASYSSKHANTFVGIFRYLHGTLPKEIIDRLLVGENDKGLRPMEYAAQQGIFNLMLEMLEFSNVIKTEQIDVISFHWCDVTEYEFNPPHGRRPFSPLYFISNMDTSRLGCKGTNDMMKWGLMNAWLMAKIGAHSSIFVLF